MNNPPHAKASEAFVAIALAGNSFMNWSGAGLLGVLSDQRAVLADCNDWPERTMAATSI
jgi:hypothetical protein